MDVARVALLGIMGVLTGLLFKSGKQEYGVFIGIAVSILIFSYVGVYLGQMKDAVASFGSRLAGSGV